MTKKACSCGNPIANGQAQRCWACWTLGAHPAQDVVNAVREEYQAGAYLKELATKYHTDQRVIKKCLVQAGVLLRSRSESMKLRLQTGYKVWNAGRRDSPKWRKVPRFKQLIPNLSTDSLQRIRYLYCVEKKPAKAIAQTVGLPGEWTVFRILQRMGIPRRSNHEAQVIRHGLSRPDAVELRTWYEGDRLTTEEIAELCGVSPPTVQNWLREAGISLRNPHYGFHGKPQVLCEDGHYVHSWYEKIIDDWLFRHHLSHRYNRRLGESRFRYDFLVGDTHIEVWGLEDIDWYAERAVRKREYYKALGVPLIEIFPADFKDDGIGQKLTLLLQQSDG